MKKNMVLMWLGKLSVCCLVFGVGLAISAILLSGIVARPGWTQAARYVAGSIVAGLPLAFVASRLRTNAVARWVLLAELAWVLAAAGMGFEAVFFNKSGMVNGLVVAILHLLELSLPVALFAGALTVLFRPAPQTQRAAVRRVVLSVVETRA